MSTPITVYPNPPILAGFPTATDPPLAAPMPADLDDPYVSAQVREGGFLTAPRGSYSSTPKTGTATSTIGLVITLNYGTSLYEVVYQLGAFTPLYSAGSTVNLGTGAYSLVRAGGFPPGTVINAIGCTPCPPPGPAGYFPVERGGKYSGNNLPTGIQNAISGGPVSFGFLLVPYATGASLGGQSNADFYGNRAGSFIGSYMTVDASGGFTGASTRSSGEDACSPRWTPGPADVGKIHSLVYTMSGSLAGAALTFYVNGALIGSATLGSGLASNNVFRVGFSGVGTSPQVYPNIGCAGCMVAGKVMSLAEIQAWNTRLRAVGAFVLPDIPDSTNVMGWEAPTANKKTMSAMSNIDAMSGSTQISFVAVPSAFAALTTADLAF